MGSFHSFLHHLLVLKFWPSREWFVHASSQSVLSHPPFLAIKAYYCNESSSPSSNWKVLKSPNCDSQCQECSAPANTPHKYPASPTKTPSSSPSIVLSCSQVRLLEIFKMVLPTFPLSWGIFSYFCQPKSSKSSKHPWKPCIDALWSTSLAHH